MRKPWYTRLDWPLLAGWIGLVGIGLIAIYSATHGPASEYLLLSVQRNFERQFMWAGISVVAMCVVLLLPLRILQKSAYFVYALSIVLVLFALLFGREINGARSWIFIGPLGFQSSELAKLGTVIAVAQLFGSMRENSGLIGRSVVAVGMILLPAALIVLQNDAGTALVFLGAIPFILYWSGIPLYLVVLIVSPAVAGYLAVVHLPTAIGFAVVFTLTMMIVQRRPVLTIASAVLTGGTTAATALALYRVLQPHQVARIVSFLDPEAYRLTSGFHVIQARAAVGSGGLFGKGFMQGNQTQMAFVPEQSTDFIFSVIGEEFGFLGSILLLLLFAFVLIRLTRLGLAARNRFAVLFAAGTTGLFFVHILINIGMNVGVMPVIGIPLPFVSYGGSALLSNSVLLAVIANLALRRHEFPRYAV